MRNEIIYEWDIETVDEHGDIQDHDHRDKLSEYHKDDINKDTVLVLVRDRGNDEEGVLDRQWAYTTIVDGKHTLPTHFEDGRGCKVPKRFHTELAKHQKHK